MPWGWIAAACFVGLLVQFVATLDRHRREIDRLKEWSDEVARREAERWRRP